MPNVTISDEKKAAVEALLLGIFPGHSVRFEEAFQAYGIVVCIDGPSGGLVHRISISGEFIDDNDAEVIAGKLSALNLGTRLRELGRDPLAIGPLGRVSTVS